MKKLTKILSKEKAGRSIDYNEEIRKRFLDYEEGKIKSISLNMLEKKARSHRCNKLKKL